ncbi:MAG TPA: ABC transporter permease [Candidatus Acidoferrales bacterium]|nr:ABC transporter permease [Candidatus Acidoferrales bacterium]
MKTRDLVDLASRNLREAALRNTLTTAGIAVGVASLVAMLSLGIGLQTLTLNRLEGTGLFNTIYVYPKTNRGGRGGRGGEAPDEARPGDIKMLTDQTRKQLAAMPHVVEVFPELRFTADLRYAGAGHVTSAASVPGTAKGTGQFDSVQGSFFSSESAPEAILHMDLAKQMADEAKIQPADLIGQEVVLRYPQRKPVPAAPNQSAADQAANDEFGMGFTIAPAETKVKIVGLVENEQAGPGGLGGVRILLPLQFVEQLNAVQGSDVRSVVQSPDEHLYTSLTVKVDDPKRVTDIEPSIKQMGFNTFSLFDATRNLHIIFTVLDLFLGMFGSLALAVASLGIINTLVMAILERRREIGVLKALGAADRDVRRLFFAEAGVMGLAGGALGVFLGWAIGKIINFGINIYLHSQNLQPEKVWFVPWWLVGAAIGFSVVVSLAAGLYPAARAARLDPVQALRYE